MDTYRLVIEVNGSIREFYTDASSKVAATSTISRTHFSVTTPYRVISVNAL